MKKNGLLICGLLSLSLVGCSGNKFKMSEEATQEEILEFLEDKEIEEMDSYTFEINVQEDYEDKSGSTVSNIDIDGKVNGDNIYYKASGTLKETSYSAAGKNTEKTKIKEEFTCLDSKEGNIYYIENSVSFDSDYQTAEKETKIKSYYADESLFGYLLDDVIEFEIEFDDDVQLFIDGDDLAMVYSTSDSHNVIYLFFDDEELEEIEITSESAFEKVEINISYEDVEISRPSDYKDFEDLTESDLDF